VFRTLELDLAPRGEEQLCAVAQRRTPGRRAGQLLGIAGVAFGFWLLGAILHGSSASADTVPSHLPISVPLRVDAPQLGRTHPVTDTVHTARHAVADVVRTTRTMTRPVLENVPVAKPVAASVQRVVHTVRPLRRTVVTPVVGRVVERAHLTVTRQLAAPMRTVAKQLPTAQPTPVLSPRITFANKAIPAASSTSKPHQSSSATHSSDRLIRPVREPVPTGWLPLAPGAESTGAGATGSAPGGAAALVIDPRRADRSARSARVAPERDVLHGVGARRPSVSPD
jgi:hypothetical protein